MRAREGCVSVRTTGVVAVTGWQCLQPEAPTPADAPGRQGVRKGNAAGTHVARATPTRVVADRLTCASAYPSSISRSARRWRRWRGAAARRRRGGRGWARWRPRRRAAAGRGRRPAAVARRRGSSAATARWWGSRAASARWRACRWSRCGADANADADAARENYPKKCVRKHTLCARGVQWEPVMKRQASNEPLPPSATRKR